MCGGRAWESNVGRNKTTPGVTIWILALVVAPIVFALLGSMIGTALGEAGDESAEGFFRDLIIGAVVGLVGGGIVAFRLTREEPLKRRGARRSLR